MRDAILEPATADGTQVENWTQFGNANVDQSMTPSTKNKTCLFLGLQHDRLQISVHYAHKSSMSEVSKKIHRRENDK